MGYGDHQGEQAYKDRLDNVMVEMVGFLKMQLYENTLPGKLIRIPYLESIRDHLATLSLDEVRELDKLTGAMPGPYNANIYYNIVVSMLNYDPVWFYRQINTGGDWDYKLIKPGNFEDFGNFHFGAVAAAFGIPEDIALRGAGWKHRIDNPDRLQPGHPFGFAPYGDDPRDQEMIKKATDFLAGSSHFSMEIYKSISKIMKFNKEVVLLLRKFHEKPM